MTEPEYNWHGYHRLPDGREVHWVEFGDPRGTPALWCHGTPGSAWEAVLAARAARRRHVRLISISRPGMHAGIPATADSGGAGRTGRTT